MYRRLKDAARFEDVPQTLQHLIGNGCGPEWLPFTFPDGPFKTPHCCCCEHDFLYEAGGTKNDFIYTENKFRFQLLLAAKSTPWYSRFLWVFVAYLYSIHTRAWGYNSGSWAIRARPLTTLQTLSSMEKQDGKFSKRGD